MNKKAIIIHGWAGKPEMGWYPWISDELKKRGYGVVVPEMPNTCGPTIKEWVPHLAKIAGEINEDTILIGHSIGCQTIMRYLQELPDGKKVGQVIFVAGWIDLLPATYADEREEKIAKPWVESPINLGKVKDKANSFVAIFSDDDPYVDLKKNRLVFKEKLGAKIVVEKGSGHFDEESGTKELAILMEYIK